MSAPHLDESVRQEAKAVSSRISRLLDAITGDACGFVLIWTKPREDAAQGTQIAYSTNLSEEDAAGVMRDVIKRVNSGHLERTRGVADS